VQRLEDLPADASFPSGHTAAAIAVYAGLVLLLTSRIRDGRVRVAAWLLAILLPIVVAMSRMYRGMHHPLDVAGGVVIGIGAISVLLFACRAAGCAERVPARARSARRSTRMRAA
jgi:membrane-associated phospholipid phosphatase